MLTLTVSQTDQLSISNVPQQALEVFWRLFPDLSFVDAVGGVVTWLEGKGQKTAVPLSQEPVTPSPEYLAATIRQPAEGKNPTGTTAE